MKSIIKHYGTIIMSDEEEIIVPPEVEKQLEDNMRNNLRKHVFHTAVDALQAYRAEIHTKNRLKGAYVSNVRFERYLDKLKKDKGNFEEKK